MKFCFVTGLFKNEFKLILYENLKTDDRFRQKIWKSMLTMMDNISHAFVVSRYYVRCENRLAVVFDLHYSSDDYSYSKTWDNFD